MFLTNDEIQAVRDSLEIQAGYDPELITTCSHLIHIQAFDEAVRNAFVLLEERLRKALNKQRGTGFQMTQYAFSDDGPFTKLLSQNKLEYEGTKDLFYGAFRLYRNPTAHTVVGYSAGESRSIISLVNLLLVKINQLAEMPQPGTFSENIEKELINLEEEIGMASVARVRVFFKQCEKLTIHPRTDAKVWIPFRKHALVQNNLSKPPKPQQVTVFYFSTSKKELGIWFPVNQYWSNIVGINCQEPILALKKLGFQPRGQPQDPYISLNTAHDQVFFDKLYELVTRVSQEFEKTLNKTT